MPCTVPKISARTGDETMAATHSATAKPVTRLAKSFLRFMFILTRAENQSDTDARTGASSGGIQLFQCDVFGSVSSGGYEEGESKAVPQNEGRTLTLRQSRLPQQLERGGRQEVRAQ